MQLIAEAYDLLRHGVGLDVPAIKGDLRRLERGRPRVLPDRDHREGARQGRRGDRQAAGRRDRRPGRAEGHRPLDGAGRARAGRAADRHHRGRVRALAVARCATSAATRPACSPARSPAALPESLVDDIRKALYASKVVAYAQGFEQMAAAARTYDWDLKMGELAKIWRGGCIIRARFLNRITESYDEHPDLVNLLMAPYFRDAVADAQDAWRKVIVAAVEQGIAGPGVLLVAGLLRRLPPRARPGEPDPGPARLLRRPHLPARGQGRLLPHALVAGRHRSPDRLMHPAAALRGQDRAFGGRAGGPRRARRSRG